MTNNIIFNAKEGQEVNEDTYYYFLEILPPAFYKGGVFQVGEPYDHTKENKPRYGTYQHKNKRYYYQGIKTRKEAELLTKQIIEE